MLWPIPGAVGFVMKLLEKEVWLGSAVFEFKLVEIIFDDVLFAFVTV